METIVIIQAITILSFVFYYWILPTIRRAKRIDVIAPSALAALKEAENEISKMVELLKHAKN